MKYKVLSLEIKVDGPKPTEAITPAKARQLAASAAKVFEELLNKQAGDGWELDAVHPLETNFGAFPVGIFKKP